MGLRENSIRIIGATLIVLTIALFVISQFFVMANILDLENQDMQQNVGRALNALDNEINALSDFVHDWSSWDDTYAFIQNNNSGYITSNLMDETFVNAKLNIIVFVDSSGKIIFEKAFDLENEEEIPVPNELNNYIKDGSLLSNSDKNVKGLVMLNETPMMVASRPILTSTDEGPAKGTLIMGRYLNKAQIQSISEITKLPIDINNINNSNANLNNAISLSNESAAIYATALSEDIVQGSSILKDINGKPILNLKIDLSRNIFKQGQNSLIYFFASIFVAEFIFGVIIIAYLDKSVLLRLTNLSTEVKGVDNDNLSSRVQVKGDDELSSLAKSINNMLAALEKSQHELKISEKGYRMLAEAAQDMIFILDHDKRFIYANSWTLEQLEQPMSAISGEKVDILFKSEISDKLEENIEKTFRNGNSNYVENKMKSGNAEKWFYTSIIPLKGNKSNVNAVLGISRDITNLKQTEIELKKYRDQLEKMVDERTKELIKTTEKLEKEIIGHKKARKELKNSEAYYRTIFENTGTANFIIEEDSVVSLVNAESETISGYSKEEIEGKKKWQELVVEDNIPEMEEYHDLRRINPKFAPRNYEFEFLDKYGNVKNVTSTVAMIPGTKKSVVSILDISEKKIAENALRKSEAQLRIAMDLAKLAAWEYDVKSDMFTFDDHFYALYGTTAEKEGGTLMSSEEYARKFVPPEEASNVVEEIGKTIETDDPNYMASVEHSIIKANGEKGFITVRYGVIKDENGRTIRTYGANQDITERKKAEKEIRKLNEDLKRRTLELETINKELESFSYSVSHDLRAPLRSIDGFSQALLEDYQDNLDLQGKNYLDRVRKASQRMAQLIDDLLNLSRLTRSKMRQEKVNLSKISHEVAEDLQNTQPERNVKFEVADGIMAKGDSKLLRVVLENLLNNAWKFTNKCSNAKIEFGVIEEKGVNIYFIRDNGAGFDMEYVDKLFNPFQRLHTVDEYPGSGIGLATVQRIIHRHNGRIWAKGEINKGATFYFTLENENDT